MAKWEQTFTGDFDALIKKIETGTSKAVPLPVWKTAVILLAQTPVQRACIRTLQLYRREPGQPQYNAVSGRRRHSSFRYYGRGKSGAVF